MIGDVWLVMEGGFADPEGRLRHSSGPGLPATGDDRAAPLLQPAIIPRSQHALGIGATLGVYEVLSAIGAGGMGEVYKARDTKLDRDVALKIFPDARRGGSPWENGYVEPFNGKLRDELLDREIFYTLTEAKILIERWRREYNTVRPHSGHWRANYELCSLVATGTTNGGRSLVPKRNILGWVVTTRPHTSSCEHPRRPPSCRSPG